MAVPMLPRIVAEEDVEAVTLADRNEEKARQLAGADPKLRAAPVDAMDHGAVVELMKEHDLCICFVGPFLPPSPV